MTRIKVQTFQTDRQQEGRPSLKFSPSSLNTRSRLWAILYKDLWEPGVLRDVYPMDLDVLMIHWEELHEIDDTPSPTPATLQLDTDVAPSHTRMGNGTEPNECE